MAFTFKLLLLLLFMSLQKADGFGAQSRSIRGLTSRYQTASNSNVDELLQLIQGNNGSSKKTPEEREQILALIERLETQGSGNRYLDDETYIGDDTHKEVGAPLLWDSYELTYFDRSIDGGKNTKEDQYKNATQPFGIRSRLLGSMFGLRYSFQHIVRPGRMINDVGFKILGLPAAVVAGGNFTRISKNDVKSIQNKTGTTLRSDTAIRIDFEEPVMWFGNKRFPFIIRLGSKAQSPPVTLCTTYADDKIRLALAAKGGRLVFTRGGKTAMAFANDWKYIDRKPPLSGGVVGTVAAAAVSAAWKWIPFARVPICLMVAIPVTLVVRTKLQTKDDSALESKILSTSSDASNESTAKENALLTNNAVEPDETREA